MKQSKNLQDDMTSDWNVNVSIGDVVEYRSYPDAEPELFTTRTEARVLNGHTAVVWLNNKRGCVSVDACCKVDR